MPSGIHVVSFERPVVLAGLRPHTTFAGCPCPSYTPVQHNKKTISHPERHFGSKMKSVVLAVQLQNSRSFAVVGAQNQNRFELEDNASVNVSGFRHNAKVE